ncbi:MAG TPA: DUF1559 domain-containing protein [Chthonomonadaceae bacterium]|nr:DUF1559 domain-containing protein [Chthonomonadaceae bacterium]
MDTRRKTHRSGFTLIELLVVIAIIAILAAILFPVFARAREQARKTACLSNMKQIGTALYMYAQDYDEILPERYGGDVPGDFDYYQGVGYERTWKNMLYPYIKNLDVFKCPSNDAKSHGQQVDSTQGFPNWDPRFAAGYSMYLPNYTPAGLFPNGGSYPQPLAGLPYPAQELIIVEGHFRWADTGPWLTYCQPFPGDPNPNCDPNGIDFWPGQSSWSSGHAKQGTNVVYMDSHAKYKHYSATFQDDPGRNNENDWRYSYNYAENASNGFIWMNTAPDDMRKFGDDGT